jgi:hypothetical protein
VKKDGRGRQQAKREQKRWNARTAALNYWHLSRLHRDMRIDNLKVDGRG